MNSAPTGRIRGVLALVPRWVLWAFAFLVVGLVVWFLLVPQFGDAEDALEAIAGINALFLAGAAAMVLAAILSQAQLTRAVLPPAERPRLVDMTRIEMATMAVSHTVPGGTAAGTALAFRLLTSIGVGRSSTGFALGIRGIGSAVVLNVILWLALVVSIPTHGFNPLYTTAAVLGIMLLGSAGAFAVGLLRARERATNLLCRVVRPLPVIDHEAVPGVLDHLADELGRLFSDRGLAARATGWAALYWLLHAAALWLLLYAFGWTADPAPLLVAFGVVNVLAAIPVTPRGLGLVEAALIPLLVSFGATAGQATLGVIAFRLLSFFAPIPLGTLSYVSLKVVEPTLPAERERARAEAVRELEESAREAAETFQEWAARHGLRTSD